MLKDPLSGWMLSSEIEDDGGAPLSLFESGAILQYLAEKTGRFLPQDLRGRQEVLQWLYWQMAGLGPMAGQNHHFTQYAPEPMPYAIERYVKETARLYGVLNQHLADGRAYIGGSAYSIADMACYPWIVSHAKQRQKLEDFPHLHAWYTRIAARPATARAYDLVASVNPAAAVPMDAAAKQVLFGQGAAAPRA